MDELWDGKLLTIRDAWSGGTKSTTYTRMPLRSVVGVQFYMGKDNATVFTRAFNFQVSAADGKRVEELLAANERPNSA